MAIKKVPECDVKHNHKKKIELINNSLPNIEKLYDLADFFKIFADSTRIRILYSLFESELCVCDIAEIIGGTHSAVSHQLRLLKNAKLVKYRREGKQILYSLSDNHVKHIIADGMEHINE